MFFSGVQTLSMDSKGRIAVPAKYRDSLSRLVIAPNPLMEDDENCLWLYPLEEWQVVQADVSSKPNTKTFRRLKRFFLGGAVEYSLDGNGRVLLTPKLREFAELNKKIVLVGQGNKFEIWDEAVWDSQLMLDDDEESRAEYQSTVQDMPF